MEDKNNQFFNFMKSCLNLEHMTNTMPNNSMFDLSSLSEVAQKNAQAITTANKLAAEGLQSVIKKTSEAYQQSAAEMLNMYKDSSASSNFEENRDRQEHGIKSCIANFINNSKDTSDILSKYSTKIIDTIGNNMAENVDNMFTKVKEKAKA
ncbi:MAG: phasin family protein [Rickettsiaceae bacterium]|nr:MAG: phasin family protein [Rickettsiaceae bacterium]